MKDKTRNIIKYSFFIIGIIFIILSSIIFTVLLIPWTREEDVPVYVMTSLEELEKYKEQSVLSDESNNIQGILKNIIDDNKLEIGGEYEEEVNITGYEPKYVYVTKNTEYIDLITLEKIDIKDISVGDRLVVEGTYYKTNESKYIKNYVDATNGIVKVLKSSDYKKMRNEYFFNKKKIDNVRLVANMPRRVSIAYDKNINGVYIPLIQIFETNGNKIKEVGKNSILDITLDKPLEINDEKNLGTIVNFLIK